RGLAAQFEARRCLRDRNHRHRHPAQPAGEGKTVDADGPGPRHSREGGNPGRATGQLPGPRLRGGDDASRNKTMTLSLFDLTGKVGVITGSSRGMGRAMAEIFAGAGTKVVISGRNIEPCQEVVDAIKAKGGEATAVTCRISDKAQCENLIAKAHEAYGRVDIM